MNWCKIIGHRWLYYEEKHVAKNRHLLRPNSIIKLDVRLCKRCFKKQMTKLGSGVYNFKLRKLCNWREIKLTKSEVREKKYKELGL